MKQHLFAIGVALVLLSAGCAGSSKPPAPANGSLAQSEAIAILKSMYPEFNGYPNDNLAPKRIIAQKNEDGWHIAFVQEGSGRPIISAKCFLVQNDKAITKIGEFNPKIGDMTQNISAITCR